MKIRKFQEKDSKQVINLIVNSLFDIFKVKPLKYELDSGLFGKGGVLYVAENKGEIVGSAGIRKYFGDIAKIKSMYINKKYRGSGLSQKLFNRLEFFARNFGYKKIILSTTPQMKAAIKFYEKNGFQKYKFNKSKNMLFF